MRDIRIALRQLLRTPGYTAVAVLTFALGIGATTAMFSVIHAVLIRPLPFPNPDRLVSVWQDYPKRAWSRTDFSLPNFHDLRGATNLFTDAGAYALSSHTLTGSGEPRRLNSLRISASLLPTLRLQPVIGRNFIEAEDRPDGDRVVLLSEAIWRSNFQADPGVIGQSIRLNDEWPATVVGVLPAGFRIGDETPELCLPLRLDPAKVGRGHRGLQVIARLTSGVGQRQLDEGLKLIAGQLRTADPWANADMGVIAVPLQDQLAGNVRRPLLLLGGAVMCVLLIACANVANLSLARALSRQSEMTIRAAVGAGRWQIVRLLMTESLLLAFLGGTAGVFLGYEAVALAQRTLASTLPQASGIRLDPTLLLFALGVSTVCGILCGLVPALSASRVDLASSLKHVASNATAGRARFRLRSTLVIAEIGLAFVLLAGAGLLLRSLDRLNRFNPGFDTSQMLIAHAVLSGARYTDNNPARLGTVRGIVARLEAMPGAGAVTFGNSLPLTSDMDVSGVAIEGRNFAANEAPMVHLRGVGGGYFQTLRVPLLDGRHIEESDNETAQPVVVVNATFARRLWPGADAIGKRIRPDALQTTNWLTVVGVVADMKNESITQPARPEVYFAYAQFPTRGVSLMLRTTVPPGTLANALRQEVWKVDGALAITDVRSLDQAKAASFSATRFQSWLLGTFAALALLLAATGVYGVLAYSVNLRSREIGIRIALGARASSIHTLVLGGGMRVVGIGIVIGTFGAFAVTRFLESLLFEVGTADPLAMVAAGVVLAGVAAIACFLPSRRAARVNPMTTLRGE